MEMTKDFVKFVAEVIALLLIFSVVFGQQGIASTTFNYLNFAEPILLQNYIATAISVGSQAPGEFYTSIKTTSGTSHTIKIFYQETKPYVSVVPPQDSFSKTTFVPTDATPIISDCRISEQEIKIPEKAAQRIMVEKKVQTNGCFISIEVGSGTVAIDTGTGNCYDGSKNGECSYNNPPKFCQNGELVDRCSQCGCPIGKSCTENENCL